MLGDQGATIPWTEIVSHGIPPENATINAIAKEATVGNHLLNSEIHLRLPISITEATADEAFKVTEAIVGKTSRIMEVAVDEASKVMGLARAETFRATVETGAKISEAATMAVAKVPLVAPGIAAAAPEEILTMVAVETAVTAAMEATASEGTIIELLIRQMKMMELRMKPSSFKGTRMKKNWMMTSMPT